MPLQTATPGPFHVVFNNGVSVPGFQIVSEGGDEICVVYGERDDVNAQKDALLLAAAPALLEMCEKAHDTFREMEWGLKLLHRPTIAEGCTIAKEALEREILKATEGVINTDGVKGARGDIKVGPSDPLMLAAPDLLFACTEIESHLGSLEQLLVIAKTQVIQEQENDPRLTSGDYTRQEIGDDASYVDHEIRALKEAGALIRAAVQKAQGAQPTGTVVLIFRAVEGYQKEPRLTNFFMTQDAAMKSAEEHGFFDPRILCASLTQG